VLRRNTVPDEGVRRRFFRSASVFSSVRIQRSLIRLVEKREAASYARGEWFGYTSHLRQYNGFVM